MHSNRKYNNRFVPFLCRRDLFQFYIVHGDRDTCLPQRCRLANAGEIQFEHLSVERGEEGGVCTCRVCVWVGLLELVWRNVVITW
jgi:hypothetical protein